jgi:hypothetical protein
LTQFFEMGTAKTPVVVKLIAGLLATSDDLLKQVAEALAERFGPIDAFSSPIDWNVSAYYGSEMGDVIRRQYVSFARLVAPGKLAGIKQLTNEMENAWRGNFGRQVNIDPGYVSTTKLVLASTKDAAHRVYLSGGIYAEVTMQFSNGSFHPDAHTYPDYAAADAMAFFNRVRAQYLAQSRTLH